MQPGGVTLALRGLERRRLVTAHGTGEEPRTWSPTLTGRAMARSLRAAAGPGRAGDERRVERSSPDPERPTPY
jgi:hypothetical protein